MELESEYGVLYMNYKLPVREKKVQLIEDIKALGMCVLMWVRERERVGRERERERNYINWKNCKAHTEKGLFGGKNDEDKILSYTITTPMFCKLQLENLCLIIHFKTPFSFYYKIIENVLLLVICRCAMVLWLCYLFGQGVWRKVQYSI